MNAVASLIKPKCKPFLPFTNSAKRCCSANSIAPDKEIDPSKSVPVESKSQNSKGFITLKSGRPGIFNNVKSKSASKDLNTSGGDCVNNDNDSEIHRSGKGPRINDMNIQMLSEELYHQIYGKNAKMYQPSRELVAKAQAGLKKYGLWKEDINFLEDVSFDLPPLSGKNIEEHFWNIGKEQSEPYKKLLLSFSTNGIPKPPEKWLCQKGWTKYVQGKKPESVSFPDDDALVFDVEVCVKLGEAPTLATAVSSTAWYGWVNSDLAEGTNSVPASHYKTDMLISFEGKTVSKETPRIIIGHNVSYDRARIKEQYYLKNSALRFLDTMSLHISIGGIARHQKTILKRRTEETAFSVWKGQSCLSSLKDVYLLYCNKVLEKENRNVFMEGELSDVRARFDALMEYCANDVKATYEVFQAIFSLFLSRFPHPVTLAGMLEMGSAYLPVNNNWNKFTADAEQTYEDIKNEISFMLSKKSDTACRLFHNQKYKEDLWMWSEDWSTQELKLTKKKLKVKVTDEERKETEVFDEEEDKTEKELTKKFQYLFDLEQLLPVRRPFLPGYPTWYRKLCEKTDSQDWTPHPQLSTGLVVTPKLLNLAWENFPLYHTSEYGWGILVADIYNNNLETLVPFEKLKELTLKNCNIDLNTFEIDNQAVKYRKSKSEPSTGVSYVPYYKGSGIWCNHTVENCCYFFKLPHKDGGTKNVGNPLSKDFTKILIGNTLKGSDSVAMDVLDLGKKLSYWRNNRERILGQMVVWLNKKEIQSNVVSDDDAAYGVIIPKVVVCGTITRRAMEATWLTASRVTENRIGSELRSMVQAPPGYHIVGADVDSQELWIASLIGDSYFAKIHGSTPLGWMTLSGSKANETDMHSVTAKTTGISRDHAKIINYARIYGAGVKFAQKLLQQFNPSMSEAEAQAKATKMYALTKGKRAFKVKDSYVEEFHKVFGSETEVCDLYTAVRAAKYLGKKLDEVFEKSHWIEGTESAMFNQLEKIANSKEPVTPFLRGRLSSSLEPKYDADYLYLPTRINWIVQSGAVDFLHLMLVCMKWLTNGRARYCFSFHDEVRYLIPSEERYNGALAMHITHLLVRAFCAHRLGMNDLPQSVAFFSAVEVDKTLRKEANDDCVTPSNPHGMAKGYGIAQGESLDIYETLRMSKGSLAPFGMGRKSGIFSFCLNKPEILTCRCIPLQTECRLKMEMSQATKRKHVHREVLQGELVPPEGNQLIVRVLGSRGNNLHEVETPESSTFLISMPNKFRKSVWIKKGDYILVEPIEEGEKVKGEMVKVLTHDYIKFLKKENIWPTQFLEDREGNNEDLNSDLFKNNNHYALDESESSDETD